jgi:hypothetical protein
MSNDKLNSWVTSRTTRTRATRAYFISSRVRVGNQLVALELINYARVARVRVATHDRRKF